MLFVLVALGVVGIYFILYITGNVISNFFGVEAATDISFGLRYVPLLTTAVLLWQTVGELWKGELGHLSWEEKLFPYLAITAILGVVYWFGSFVYLILVSILMALS